MNGNNKRKKIAVFGTFDVDNYGDLLFPHIAEYRLENYDLEFVSPTCYKTKFDDSKEVIKFTNSLNKTYDAVLIGGGNIIHLEHNTKTIYKDISEFSYADLWVGAVNLAAKLGKPSLFNAPGISHLFRTNLQREIAKSVFSSSSYLAFREDYSTNIAKSIYSEDEIVPLFQTTIDTAFEISKIWPCDRPREKKIIVNLNPRYHKPIVASANFLTKISKKTKCKIKFIIIGDCHGDYDFTCEVANLIEEKDDEIFRFNTLKDIAFDIATAKYFIGSSMHGFITALSYGTPAFLVLNSKPMHKFKGLYEKCELQQTSLCESFEDCLRNIKYPSILIKEHWKIINRILDRHWEEVEEIIEKGKATTVCRYRSGYRELLTKEFQERESVRNTLMKKVKNKIKKYIGY